MYRLLGKTMYYKEILNDTVPYPIHGSEIMIKFCKVIITVKHSSLFTKFLLIYMSIHEKNLFDNLFFLNRKLFYLKIQILIPEGIAYTCLKSSPSL